MNKVNSNFTVKEIALLMSCANDVADSMRELILQLWSKGDFKDELKEDKTPVTEVDKKAELLAREIISSRYPTHGIFGEEFPSVNPESDFIWTIDPIDGTQNLINNIPTFGSLLGLRYKGEAIYGVIDHPVLDLRINGGMQGVFCNGLPVGFSDLKSQLLVANDIIATNSPAVFGEDTKDRELFDKVISFHPHSRIYYDCYDQTLAVLGKLAVVVEPNLKIWDITPLEALMSNIGGACVRFNERGSGSSLIVNAVFGKPKAVELMLRYLGL